MGRLRLGIMDGGTVELERDVGRPFAVLSVGIRKGLARVEVEYRDYEEDDPDYTTELVPPGALLHYLSVGSMFSVVDGGDLIDGHIEAIDRKRGRIVVLFDAPREVGIYRPEYRDKLARAADPVEVGKEG